MLMMFCLIRTVGCVVKSRNIQNVPFFNTHPIFFIILVNRFSFENGMDFKEQNTLQVENEIGINTHKFTLCAIIHHHGPTLRSGHYTSSIISHNVLYTCNDNSVSSAPMVDVMESNTAYIVFYRLLE